MKRTNPEFMNGVPELLILRALARTEMYGYELVRAITDATNGTIIIGEGVAYPVLHALERDGCLKSRRRVVSGRPRVYYRITARGERRLEQSSTDWSRMAAAVQAVLGGGAHDARAVV